MKSIKTFAVLALVVAVALTGLYLTANAGSVSKQGSTLLKNRYGVTATVDELNYSDGVTSNIQTQLDAKTTSTLADTKVFIGNSGGVAVAQSLSGDITITNAGVATLGADSVESANIVDNTVATADILNGTITDNDMGWLKETLIINSGATSNSTSANATYNGTLLVQPWQNAADAYIINTTMIANGTATVVLNGAAPSDFKVQVIRTKP